MWKVSAKARPLPLAWRGHAWWRILASSDLLALASFSSCTAVSDKSLHVYVWGPKPGDWNLSGNFRALSPPLSGNQSPTCAYSKGRNGLEAVPPIMLQVSYFNLI